MIAGRRGQHLLELALRRLDLAPPRGAVERERQSRIDRRWIERQDRLGFVIAARWSPRPASTRAEHPRRHVLGVDRDRPLDVLGGLLAASAASEQDGEVEMGVEGPGQAATAARR